MFSKSELGGACANGGPGALGCVGGRLAFSGGSSQLLATSSPSPRPPPSVEGRSCLCHLKVNGTGLGLHVAEGLLRGPVGEELRGDCDWEGVHGRQGQPRV